MWLPRTAPCGPPPTPIRAPNDLACLSSSADFEAFLVGDAIDRALAQLDRREAMIIRRRHLAEQDWATITQEMHFANLYQAQKTYKQAMRKLTARHDAPPVTKPRSTA